MIEFAGNRFLIIETKLPLNHFNSRQFENHINGACQVFGGENCWYLFISGDKAEPAELGRLRSLHPGRIGFIRWCDLLKMISGFKDRLDKPFSILISEFLTLAQYYRLGRATTTMDKNDFNTFLEYYPIVYRFQEAVQETLQKLLLRIVDRIILESGERATMADATQEKFPAIHRSLHVKTWHTTRYSVYVEINAVLKRVALLGVGYEDSPKVQQDFLPLWNGQFKRIYQRTADLHAFRWVGDGEEETCRSGHFKLVPGTNGKSFDPTQIGELERFFYWGFFYPLDPANMGERFIASIGADAKSLITLFTPKRLKRA